ncbi:SDR family oxidoreductase [Nocardioides convexus]|uniref:SDR family oxidoreductase n=1 Tax=Nocardioides convexus TaxID=2712224 RepID=UPI0024185967|nr:SDR family oxidoreductase [Nocardioides convexus]
MMGRTAARGYLAYGVAKAALAHWTRLAATDLAPGIRVNGVYVGSVMTSALEFVAGVPAMKEQMEQATPLGRIGEAEDIAAAVVYLSSRAGQFVTGKPAGGRRRHPAAQPRPRPPRPRARDGR